MLYSTPACCRNGEPDMVNQEKKPKKPCRMMKYRVCNGGYVNLKRRTIC
jgi:hypothetical protein